MRVDEAACNQQQETVVRLITENKVLEFERKLYVSLAEIFIDFKNIHVPGTARTS